MFEIKMIAVEDIAPDPSQPRKFFDESEILALGQNIKTYGQQLPVILFELRATDGGARRYMVLDGEKRWRANSLNGVGKLSSIVLQEKPSAVQLAMIRASIDFHRSGLRATERGALLTNIQKETGKSVSEIAAMLNISQSYASKLLGIQRLDPKLRCQVDEGILNVEDAYLISQEPEPAKQLLLAAEAGKLSRTELSQRASGKTARHDVGLSNVRLAMPGGLEIGVKGREVTFALLIEVLAESVRMLKKGQAQGLTLASQIKVMRDTAKARRPVPEAMTPLPA